MLEGGGGSSLPGRAPFPQEGAWGRVCFAVAARSPRSFTSRRRSLSPGCFGAARPCGPERAARGWERPCLLSGGRDWEAVGGFLTRSPGLGSCRHSPLGRSGERGGSCRLRSGEPLLSLLTARALVSLPPGIWELVTERWAGGSCPTELGRRSAGRSVVFAAVGRCEGSAGAAAAAALRVGAGLASPAVAVPEQLPAACPRGEQRPPPQQGPALPPRPTPPGLSLHRESRRKTPVAVALKENERLFGDSALGMVSSQLCVPPGASAPWLSQCYWLSGSWSCAARSVARAGHPVAWPGSV